jgi:alpha-ketoglutarate-dependent taurine dioxygenase
MEGSHEKGGPTVPDLQSVELTPALGSEVKGFTQDLLDDAGVCRQLQELFDDRGVLVFRELDLTHAAQLRIAEVLIQKELGPGTPREDRWYISNRREKSAAPYGRLQFHADMMWSDEPCELISLYAVEVEPPVSPTTFVSTTHGWASLGNELRSRVEGRHALHTAGEVRRGDMSDVILTDVENPPTTVKPLELRHSRTGQSLLYACEQMTKAIVDVPESDSEPMLEELFAVMYDEEVRLDHQWLTGDFVVWDNLAVQHGRPNVAEEGPTRTLRKVAAPMPVLTKEQMPTYVKDEHG